MQIGILGGSFNPPHQGHVNLSLEAKRLMNLDQIWWQPTKQNPLKQTKSEDFDKKLQKCYKITNHYQEISVRDDERFLKNISIDLIKNLISSYPKYKFYWLMGADSIIDFHLWDNWQEIIKLTDLIIGDRDGYKKQCQESTAYNYAKNLGKCYFLQINKLNISSTEIRKNKILI